MQIWIINEFHAEVAKNSLNLLAELIMIIGFKLRKRGMLVAKNTSSLYRAPEGRNIISYVAPPELKIVIEHFFYQYIASTRLKKNQSDPLPKINQSFK